MNSHSPVETKAYANITNKNEYIRQQKKFFKKKIIALISFYFTSIPFLYLKKGGKNQFPFLVQINIGKYISLRKYIWKIS